MPARADAEPMPPSALYVGVVTHQRLSPRRHRLRYRMFSVLIDLDDLAGLDRRLRLLSINRFNVFSLHESDHGDRRPTGLRDWVDSLRQAAGLVTGGRIRMLTMPRILGHGFNPLTVYFLDRPDGARQAMLYEVRNTFGERHAYLVPVVSDGAAATEAASDGALPASIEQRCPKDFHVSPFLPMALDYRFDITPPDAAHTALSIGVTVMDGDRPVLVARYGARGRPLGDRQLLRVAFTHPLLTLKVVAGIHWEALKLWRKGIALHPRPAAPTCPVSIIPPEIR